MRTSFRRVIRGLRLLDVSGRDVVAAGTDKPGEC